MGIVVLKSEMTGLVPAETTQLPELLPPAPLPPEPVDPPPPVVGPDVVLDAVVLGPVVVWPVVDPEDPVVLPVDPAPPAPELVPPVVVCAPVVVCVPDVCDEPPEPLGLVVDASSEQAAKASRRMLGPIIARFVFMVVRAFRFVPSWQASHSGRRHARALAHTVPSKKGRTGRAFGSARS
jgi:hypothetical protein